MATFTIKAPDGNSYRITGDSEEGAINALQQHLDAKPPQSATEAFSAAGAVPPKEVDQYDQAAIDEAKANAPTNSDFKNSIAGQNVRNTADIALLGVNGATLNHAADIQGAIDTPAEMWKRGTLNPFEAYRYARSRDALSVEEAKKRQGYLGMAAEVAGGIPTGGVISKAVTPLIGPAAALAGRAAPYLTTAADAALQGGIIGAGEGDTAADRVSNAAKGVLIGGALGPAAHAVGSVIGKGFNNYVRPIFAGTDANAEGQIARAVTEAKLSPAEIDSRVAQANAEGQGVYTNADAMGKPASKLLGSAYRDAGDTSQTITDTLNDRQLNQADRVTRQLREGFGRPESSSRLETALDAERQRVNDINYPQARAGAGQVDFTPTINRIDAITGTGAGQTVKPPADSIEGAILPFRERLVNVNPDDFEAVQRLYDDLGDAAFAARGTNRGRLIGQVHRQLGASMEHAAPGFAEANAAGALGRRNVASVGAGREASQAGALAEDIIPDVQGLENVAQRQGYRAGFIDPAIAKVQNAAEGVNKARPFTSDKFRQVSGEMNSEPVSDALVPQRPGAQPTTPDTRDSLMQRQLRRENQMFQTRAEVAGGSQTAERLKDDENMKKGVELVTMAAHGFHNPIPFIGHGVKTVAGHFTGNTPEVRSQITEILLRNGTTGTPGEIAAIVNRVQRNLRLASDVAERRAKTAALAVAREKAEPDSSKKRTMVPKKP